MLWRSSGVEDKRQTSNGGWNVWTLKRGLFMLKRCMFGRQSEGQMKRGREHSSKVKPPHPVSLYLGQELRIKVPKTDAQLAQDNNHHRGRRKGFWLDRRPYQRLSPSVRRLQCGWLVCSGLHGQWVTWNCCHDPLSVSWLLVLTRHHSGFWNSHVNSELQTLIEHAVLEQQVWKHWGLPGEENQEVAQMERHLLRLLHF